jgi:hypothetical protein
MNGGVVKWLEALIPIPKIPSSNPSLKLQKKTANT